MKIKQVIDGLVRTTELDNRNEYFTVEGVDATYQGVHLNSLHLHSTTTGLPMSYEANLRHYFRAGMKAAALAYCPTLQDSQWEAGDWETPRKESAPVWEYRAHLINQYAAEELWLTDRPAASAEPWAEIDGERYPIEVQGDVPLAINTGDKEFVCFPDQEAAGIAARSYYQELALDDPAEFLELIGAENTLGWALGRLMAPGSIPVNSLDEWFDLSLTQQGAAEHWGSYDGKQCELILSPSLIEQYGEMVVAYRTW